MINKLSRSYNQDINCSLDIQYGSSFSRSHATVTFDQDSRMGRVDAIVLSVASTSSIGSNSPTIRLHCSCKNLISRLPIPFSNPTLTHIAQRLDKLVLSNLDCGQVQQVLGSDAQHEAPARRAFKTGKQNARRSVFPDPVSAATQMSPHSKT
jgi:hypothetical protein